MRMTVLGAAGSIGHAFVRRARLEGHEVRAVVRDLHKVQDFPRGTEVVGADLFDATAVQRACRGSEVIVHAGNVPYLDWPKRVPLMAGNALKAAEATGALLAFPGNVYVYGHPRTRPVAEDHSMEPHTTKGRIRLQVEREFLRAHREGRARVVIPRYPDFYGPRIVHEFYRPIFEGALTAKSCRWPIDADAPHEFIFIDDAADAMLRLIETKAAHGRAVHVPGPSTITPRQFIALCYRFGGHEPKVRVFGRGLWRLIGLFNPVARSALEMSYLFDDPVILDGALYRVLTGAPHPAAPYEEAVRETMEWYRTYSRPS